MAIPVAPKQGDFSNVKDSDFEPLEGPFTAKVAKFEHRDAKPETAAKFEAKNPGEHHPGLIHVEFDITQEPYTRRKVWSNVPLNHDGMKKQFLTALGYTAFELNDPTSRINTVGLEPESEVGKAVRLVCRKSRLDETQTDVKSILPPSVTNDLPV